MESFCCWQSASQIAFLSHYLYSILIKIFARDSLRSVKANRFAFCFLKISPPKAASWRGGRDSNPRLKGTESLPLFAESNSITISAKYREIYRNLSRVGLEEPMAVTIGQIQFLKEFFPDRLNWESRLYNNPWISFFAKAINPIIEKDWKDKKIFTVETGKKLGLICNESFRASRFVEAKWQSGK